MANSVPIKSASTQKFIEIVDIVDDVVILEGGNACLIIEVEATNFALLAPEEQDAKIYAYAALLNSLSFSVQIVIRSKRLNVSNYLKLLEQEKLNSKNPALAQQIGLYKDFVTELVKVNTILDKKFYIIIPYSSLEKGVIGAKEQTGIGSAQSMFVIGAKTALHSKAESLLNQLKRLSLKAQTLNREGATKLFYEIFNDASLDASQDENISQSIQTEGAK